MLNDWRIIVDVCIELPEVNQIVIYRGDTYRTYSYTPGRVRWLKTIIEDRWGWSVPSQDTLQFHQLFATTLHTSFRWEWRHVDLSVEAICRYIELQWTMEALRRIRMRFGYNVYQAIGLYNEWCDIFGMPDRKLRHISV